MFEVDFRTEYNQYKLRALLDYFGGREKLNQHISQKMDELFEAVIPDEVKNHVESQIEKATEQERYNFNTFSLIYLTDGDEEIYMTCQDIHSLYDIASLYANDLEDMIGLSLDSICDRFGDYKMIDESVYNVLSRAFLSDERIAAKIHLDFDAGLLFYRETEGGLTEYPLHLLQKCISESQSSSSWEDDQVDCFNEMIEDYTDRSFRQTM